MAATIPLLFPLILPFTSLALAFIPFVKLYLLFHLSNSVHCQASAGACKSPFDYTLTVPLLLQY